jgi:hypothetical protein
VRKLEKSGHGPKYEIDIEGKIIPWNEDTITTEQIIQLGGWDSKSGVIEVDLKTNTERTIKPGEIITLKPGLGFSKKVLYKRGLL